MYSIYFMYNKNENHFVYHPNSDNLIMIIAELGL